MVPNLHNYWRCSYCLAGSASDREVKQGTGSLGWHFVAIGASQTVANGLQFSPWLVAKSAGAVATGRQEGR
jgi:hypothetical protein